MRIPSWEKRPNFFEKAQILFARKFIEQLEEIVEDATFDLEEISQEIVSLHASVCISFEIFHCIVSNWWTEAKSDNFWGTYKNYKVGINHVK